MQNMNMIRTAEKASVEFARLLQKDPGGRGLLSGPVGDRTKGLAQSLARARRAVLLTGFPVRRFDGEVVGETDGPSGTANIAFALEECGAEVVALTDRFCFPQLKAALKARGARSEAVMIPDNTAPEFFKDLFRGLSPTHLITLERPGKARDGHFYNMRGIQIDALLTDTDSIIQEARQANTNIISVGDGGNELGMGALRPLIEKRVPQGGLICADAAADVTLVSGVSNWWGWGIAAVCSIIYGKDLLPTPETEQEMLRAVIASGGADGCTGLMEETVDGLPARLHWSVLEEIRDSAGAFPGCDRLSD